MGRSRHLIIGGLITDKNNRIQLTISTRHPADRCQAVTITIRTAIIPTIGSGTPDKGHPTGRATIIIVIMEMAALGKAVIGAMAIHGEGITTAIRPMMAMITRHITGLRIIRTMKTIEGTIGDGLGTDTGIGAITEIEIEGEAVVINGGSVRLVAIFHEC